MHNNADRAIVGYVSCTTEALARQELAVIAASCTVGSSLTWQPDGQTSAVSCTVLAVDIDVPAFDPVSRRIAVASGHIDVTVSLRTTPYWLGPEVETTLSMTSGTPFTATISGVGGDVPALTKVRYTHAQATSMLALAMRSNPGEYFAPIEDYPGTNDAAAFGGACTVAYHGTTTPYPIGTAIPVAADNAGDFLVLARVKQEGAVLDTFYRAATTMQGAVGDPLPEYGSEVHPVTTASAGWDVLDLGVVLMGGRVSTALSVQERCLTASKDTFLDVVASLPADEACVKVTTAAAAGQGICIDYLSDNDADHDIYICDATDTGISVISGAEPYGGPFLLRPGDTTLVGMAATPGTAAPGDATLVVTYRPRYLLPYTGE
jgi:hypothetical protein